LSHPTNICFNLPTMRHLSALLPLIAILLSGCKTADTKPTVVAEANQPTPRHAAARATTLPILFIVGDSTVHNESPGLVGWGDVIGTSFDSAKIRVENHAKPGRSTRTFISQGWWKEILATARPGDYVIIQMGHNDTSPINDTNRSRGTIPGIGEASTNFVNGLTHLPETVHTYGWYLRKYIAEARAKGMTPILCTPVSRLPQPGRELDTTRYANWMRQVAAAENVPLIDLNQRALESWGNKSPEEIKTTYFAGTDTTHFNRTGAELNASCVVDGIRALRSCPLKDFLVNKP
jgi:lysophospholipase L1-like esterase